MDDPLNDMPPSLMRHETLRILNNINYVVFGPDGP